MKTNETVVAMSGRVLVMGLAKSGEAAARLLQRRGMNVVATDRRERQTNDSTADLLESEGIKVVLGEHPLSLLDEPLTFIVKNPGIPYSAPLVVEAVRRNIPVYTEIEVASWLTQAPIYAITGSNGKTTTTTLVGEILQSAGLQPVVAGNIGLALSSVIDEVEQTRPIVLEVSSFQLQGTERFHPRIGALLNIYPSHLDYHQTLESYVAAKMKLFQNMTMDDVAVLNYDSVAVRREAHSIGARIVWFSRISEVPEGVFVENDMVVARSEGQQFPIIALSAIALKGEHHLENALAAAAIALRAGAPVDAIAEVLSRFKGVEHRLEFVRTVEGVDYFNDSKATNPQAALHALKSLPTGIVWIAGGLDRGDDLSPLSEELAARVKYAVLLGQSSPRFQKLCGELGIACEMVPNLEQAVFAAHRRANAGEVVLLSPASASWDMFSSFEERGRMFKETVHRL